MQPAGPGGVLRRHGAEAPVAMPGGDGELRPATAPTMPISARAGPPGRGFRFVGFAPVASLESSAAPEQLKAPATTPRAAARVARGSTPVDDPAAPLDGSPASTHHLVSPASTHHQLPGRQDQGQAAASGAADTSLFLPPSPPLAGPLELEGVTNQYRQQQGKQQLPQSRLRPRPRPGPAVRQQNRQTQGLERTTKTTQRGGAGGRWQQGIYQEQGGEWAARLAPAAETQAGGPVPVPATFRDFLRPSTSG